MKILHINASYKPAFIYGGPTVSVAKLCEELQALDKAEGSEFKAERLRLKAEDEYVESDAIRDIQVVVYTTLANGKEELPYKNGELKLVNGVPVHYFKRITKDHSHLSPGLLRHLWKTVDDFDLVHIHAWWNLVSVGAALICVLKRKKFILSPRGTLSSYSFYNRKSLFKRMFHFVLGEPLLKKAIFQVSSEKEKRDIQQILGTKAKCHVVPNFVELKGAWEIKRKKGKDNAVAQLLFFSRIEQKKGLEFLLEACAHLKIPYHLSIAGTGEVDYVSSLKVLATHLELDRQITWLGQVATEDKFKILAAYDLLVLPSYDENFANVVIESLAVGTPVLISPKVGLADYVMEKKLGWVVKQDKLLINEKIEDIFKNSHISSAVGEYGMNTIRKDYSEETLKKNYLDFYGSILQK